MNCLQNIVYTNVKVIKITLCYHWALSNDMQLTLLISFKRYTKKTKSIHNVLQIIEYLHKFKKGSIKLIQAVTLFKKACLLNFEVFL